MKELFVEGLTFQLRGRLWVESEQDRFLGPGRIELMQKIIEFGSISKVAAAMEMSYKKAWDLIFHLTPTANANENMDKLSDLFLLSDLLR